jgi:uncharacterized protein YcbX
MSDLLYLKRIEIFPIKSLDGVIRTECSITSGGILENDRIFAITDQEGKVVNGKRTERVHQLRSTFSTDIDEVRLLEAGQTTPQQFSLKDTSLVNRWLSDFFGFQVTLKREPEKGFPDDLIAFGPTITSEPSLRAVREWYPELTLESVRRRFRTNLELDGGMAFCEDSLYGAPGELKPFQIGHVKFSGHNPCQRCVVPTRDPDQGTPVSEFQKKFMQLRKENLPAWANATRFNHFYRFAVNTSIAASESGKKLRAGDLVKI